VAVAAGADAAVVRSWGYTGPLTVLGHPADNLDGAGALLDRLRREAL